VGEPHVPHNSSRLILPPTNQPPQLNTAATVSDRVSQLDEKRRQWQADIAALQRDLETKRKQLEELPPPVDNQAAITAISKEGTQLSEQVRGTAGLQL